MINEEIQLAKIDALIEPFLSVCHLLYDKGFVCAYDGNVSCRIGNIVMSTPSHLCKKYLKKEDIIFCDEKGTQLYGLRKPTSELKMHLAVYQARSDVRCIIHAHPLYATAVFRNIDRVDTSILTESEETFPELPLLPRLQHGSLELSNAVGDIAKRGVNGCMLEAHGAVVWSDDLMTTYFLMESLERLAKTSYLIQSMK